MNTHRAWMRSAHSATVAGFAIVALSPLSAPSQAPSVGPGRTTPTPSVSELLARIVSLELRVQALEKRVKKIEDTPQGGDSPGDKTPKEIESKVPKSLTVRAPFTIVDDDDRTIMRVVVGKDGPSLTMTSSEGTTVIEPGWMRVLGEGVKGGGVGLGKGASGHGGFALYDKSGQGVVTMGYLAGENRLTFRMLARNQVFAEIGEDEQQRGSGRLRLGNGRGQYSAELGTNPRNEMALRIRGASNQVVAGFGVDPDGGGGGALKMANDKGVILASVVAKARAGHVNILGEDGNARANIGAEPDGRGFVRVGTSQNPEAASITVSVTTGGGVLQVKDKGGIGVTVGPKQTKSGGVLGDMCVNSSSQKGICFSMLAAMSAMPYQD